MDQNPDINQEAENVQPNSVASETSNNQSMPVSSTNPTNKKGGFPKTAIIAVSAAALLGVSGYLISKGKFNSLFKSKPAQNQSVEDSLFLASLQTDTALTNLNNDTIVSNEKDSSLALKSKQDIFDDSFVAHKDTIGKTVKTATTAANTKKEAIVKTEAPVKSSVVEVAKTVEKAANQAKGNVSTTNNTQKTTATKEPQKVIVKTEAAKTIIPATTINTKTNTTTTETTPTAPVASVAPPPATLDAYLKKIGNSKTDFDTRFVYSEQCYTKYFTPNTLITQVDANQNVIRTMTANDLLDIIRTNELKTIISNKQNSKGKISTMNVQFQY